MNVPLDTSPPLFPPPGPPGQPRTSLSHLALEPKCQRPVQRRPGLRAYPGRPESRRFPCLTPGVSQVVPASLPSLPRSLAEASLPRSLSSRRLVLALPSPGSQSRPWAHELKRGEKVHLRRRLTSPAASSPDRPTRCPPSTGLRRRSGSYAFWAVMGMVGGGPHRFAKTGEFFWPLSWPKVRASPWVAGLTAFARVL